MKKRELRSDEEAFEDWMNRNKWLLWIAITAIAISLISLIGLFLF
jgi:hypothetical protein